MKASKGGSVLTVKLDPILSQIMDALKRAEPDRRLTYLSNAMNLCGLKFSLRQNKIPSR